MHPGGDEGAYLLACEALEETGADEEDILARLRSEGAFVRDCKVIDLELGKE